MSAAVLCSKPLRVYVVEPQALLGKALCRFLSSEGDVAVAGESPQCDKHLLAQAHPDVVLLDADSSPSEITDVVSRVRAWLPDVRVCILSSHASATAMMRAISAGADGYVIKDITPAELAVCIKKIGTDGFYADPRLTGKLVRECAKDDRVRLSPREIEVAKLVAEGLSNKKIADRLLVSDKTVKNHIANIFAKLDISARAQIAVYAVRKGIA
jgi:NarL family two-component system response regulator LiaR